MRKSILFALMGIMLMGCSKPSNKQECQYNKQECQCESKVCKCEDMACKCKCDQMKKQVILDNILTRVSVRQFTGDTLTCEQIETLLRCAMSAPSAINSQPWAFMVITDKDMLNRIGTEMPNSRCANHPACAFVMCGDMDKALPDAARDFWVNDVSAATENLLLAAHAMGLGAVWTGIHPNMERVAMTQNLLGLPANIIPMCIVPVGVPAETPDVKDKWNADNVHYNVW